MRLVFHVTEAELRSGKPIVLGLSGIEQLTIHFDPPDEAEVIKPTLKMIEDVVEEPSKVVPIRRPNNRDYKTGKFPCDLPHNCGKRFQTKRGLKKHSKIAAKLESRKAS